MIVKLKVSREKQIFILESVMQRGVSFTSWKNFREYNDIYDEVFFRKLKTNRDKEFYKKLDDFVE